MALCLLRPIVLLCVLLARTILGASGQNCVLPSSQYVVVPLGPCNIIDSGGHTIHSWGSEVSVANQPVCMEVSTATNNLQVISSAVCPSNNGNVTVAQCSSQRGGLFQTADNSAFNNTPKEDLVSDPGWYEWGNAEVAIRGSLDISDIALPLDVGVITSGVNFTAGHLPLTNQSLLLQTLLDNGFIAERAFGIQIGTQIMTNPQPGALILGGFNMGRLGSPFTNFTMDYPITPPGGDRECPIQVTIASFIYQSPSRGDTTLLGNGQQITACVEPYDIKFRFHEPIMTLFKSAIGLTQNLTINDSSFLRPEPGLLVPNNITFDGSFAFRITSGNESFSVNIPNKELYGPVTGIASDGSITSLTNASISEIGIYSTAAPLNTAVLSRIFLSQVYLYVNYDQERFSFAQAATGMDSVAASSASIHLKCNEYGLDSGSIAAIVVGVIVFLLILTLFFLLWKLYKRQAEAIAPKEELMRGEDAERGNGVIGTPSPKELDQTTQQADHITELSSSPTDPSPNANRLSLQLSTSARTHWTWPHPQPQRRRPQRQHSAGSAANEIRSVNTRPSVSTTMTGGAGDGERRRSEFADKSTQCDSPPPSPRDNADQPAQGGEQPAADS